MIKKTVDEVYAANDAVREKLKVLVDSVDPAMLDELPDGEKWTVANIVEHLELVEESMTRVCAKLLRKAEAAGAIGDGSVTISNAFVEKGNEVAGIKVEAPGFVQPTGERNISESLSKMEENRLALNDLKPMFAQYSTTEYHFPHPFFGDLSAGEWLSLIGAHEARHIRQIKTIIRSLKQ